MGYGRTFQDFKINVHISGRQGPAGIKAVLPRLSQEARNCITIENEENVIDGEAYTDEGTLTLRAALPRTFVALAGPAPGAKGAR